MKTAEAERAARRWKKKNGSGATDTIQGVQYYQDIDESKLTAGTDGKKHNIKCFNCNRMGHYASECPEKQTGKGSVKMEETHLTEQTDEVGDEVDDEKEGVLMSYCYHLEEVKAHDDNDVLIDTGSTVSVFKNEKLLTKVHNVKQKMRALTNGGFQDSSRKGTFPGFFEVWVNTSSRLNILAWKDVRRNYRITADTAVANEITVHLSEGKR